MDHRSSLFSQKLDRVAFTAYFLGAIVPLIALGIIVDRFVLPTVSDRLASIGLIGALVSIAVLSLASFLTLRRTTRQSLAMIDRENTRLAALLDAARAMSQVQHTSDAAEAAARGALELTGARACLVVERGAPGEPPNRLAAVGDDAEKLEQELHEPLIRAMNLVLSGGSPVMSGAGSGCPALAAAPLPAEAAPGGALVAIAHPGQAEFDAGALGALSTLGGIAAVTIQNADLQDAQRNFFTHVTDILVAALDSHLGYNQGHSTRVARYANRVGRKLGLAEHRLERLHFAALLHDIGMLKLDRSDKMDRRMAQRHALLGSRMLSRIRLWQEMAPLVQHHHEWWDGSGYPDGICGNEIPLESRIIGLCDAFDTITSESSYKQPLPIDQAIHEMEAHAGTQFDPELVGALVSLIHEGVVSPNE
ncbi:MAG: HD-GYP domain-containing protein [Myxococcota bacterium]